MLRKFGVAGLLLAGFAFAVTALTAADEKKEDKKDEKPATIEECMAFQGKKGLAAKIGAAAKDGKWDDAKKDAAKLAFLGTSLGKNTPPQNADKKEEWAKVTKQFADDTAAVETAVKAEKAEDAFKAVQNLLDGKKCQACHSNFKPK